MFHDNNEKNIWIISGLILTLTITLLIALSLKKRVSEVCFPNYCFSVETAETPEVREKGLMFRKTLGQNEGVLFIFPKEENYFFWMKNTLIPLDIIWINQNKEVVFISENNQPCEENDCPLISPDEKAKYALEINAGLTEKMGLLKGNKIEFK